MKKVNIILVITLFALIIIGVMGVLLVNKIFPVAEQIKCPEVKDIITMNTYTYLSNNSRDETVEIPITDYSSILELISNSKGTRKMSVQDTPGLSEYYSIEIKTDSRIYCYFIYEENGVTYIEKTYEGIYIAEKTLLENIKTYHTENYNSNTTTPYIPDGMNIADENRFMDIREDNIDDFLNIKENKIIETYRESVENHINHTYYKMSDGTWQADHYSYKYRLEITGKMPNTTKDSTFVYLSNIEEISFEQAYLSAGVSNNTDDYFDVKDAILVEMY